MQTLVIRTNNTLIITWIFGQGHRNSYEKPINADAKNKRCSQIVKSNDASVLFYFSSSMFLNLFMVPSLSVLTEFHCFIKSNICQKVMQTSCESRTVSWKLTTKTDCDVQELRCCQYSVDYIFCTLTLIPELMVEGNCLFQQQCKLLNDCWIRQLEGMLLYFA